MGSSKASDDAWHGQSVWYDRSNKTDDDDWREQQAWHYTTDKAEIDVWHDKNAWHDECDKTKDAEQPTSQCTDKDLAIRILKVLRHKADAKGLDIDDDGFIALQDLMQLKRFKLCKAEHVWQLVNDDPRRFTTKTTNDRYMVRANYKCSGMNCAPQ